MRSAGTQRQISEPLLLVLCCAILLLCIDSVAPFLASPARIDARPFYSETGTLPPKMGDALVVDLDGDGIETVAVESGAHFDYDGDRFAELTGWPAPDDALLVLDANGDGLVDGGGELLGNSYVLGTGRKASDAFEALRDLDSSGDGVVDADDELFSALRLWRDANGNGKVDEGELTAPAEAGITGLSVRCADQTVTDENGNVHRQSGSFVRGDGATGGMEIVWFRLDYQDTAYLDAVAINDKSILDLPDMKEIGRVPSMHLVMARDKTGGLQKLLEQFVASDPLEAGDSVWGIIFAWTGVSGVDPGSYPRFNGDARKLYAMERISNTVFGDGRAYFGPSDHRNLESWFKEWEGQVTAYLLLCTHYTDLYNTIADAHEQHSRTQSTKALDESIGSVRLAYENGDAKKKREVLDFISQLRVYDPAGLAWIAYAEQFFTEPDSGEPFVREVSLLLRSPAPGSEENQ